MRIGWFTRFWRDQRGGIGVAACVAFPLLVVAAGGTADYASLFRRQTQLQAAVDQAALMTAKELSVSGSDNYIVARGREVAKETAAPGSLGSFVVEANVLSGRKALHILVRERAKLRFGRFLGMSEVPVVAEATAEIYGATTICLLALDTKSKDTLHLHKNAAVTAPKCSLFANSSNKASLDVEDGATVQASLLCSVGGTSIGRATISGQVQSNCPLRDDPLASRQAPPMAPCSNLVPVVIDGKKTPTAYLSPGTYCKGLKVTNGAVVTLAAGIYAIDNGPLVVDKGGSIIGRNVGFYFTGDAGGLLFDVKSSIDLTAPKDGPMAGLLFFENRSVTAPTVVESLLKLPPPPPPPGSPPMRQYRIVSNDARNLLGTIYLPAGRLIIDASQPIADKSAYTIIVARQVELFDGPNLYLNTNYGIADVPVPVGVGNVPDPYVKLSR